MVRSTSVSSKISTHKKGFPLPLTQKKTMFPGCSVLRIGPLQCITAWQINYKIVVSIVLTDSHLKPRRTRETEWLLHPVTEPEKTRSSINSAANVSLLWSPLIIIYSFMFAQMLQEDKDKSRWELSLLLHCKKTVYFKTTTAVHPSWRISLAYDKGDNVWSVCPWRKFC